MVYGIGDIVVVAVYKDFRVGKIVSKNKIKNSNAYDVKLEDGRLIENCSLNKEIANGFLINNYNSIFSSFNLTESLDL
jgi:hypothetical protein